MTVAVESQQHCMCETCCRFRRQVIEQAAEIEGLRGDVRQLRQWVQVVRGRVNEMDLAS